MINNYQDVSNRIMIINDYGTRNDEYFKYDIPQNELDDFANKYPINELDINLHKLPEDMSANVYKMYLPYINEGNYLELGCGTGMLAKFLCTFSSKKIIPHGIDLNPESILLAKKNNPQFAENFLNENFFQTLKDNKFNFKKFSTISLFVSLINEGSLISELITPLLVNNRNTSFIITDYDYDLFNIKDKEVVEFTETLRKISTVSIVCHSILIVGNNSHMHKIARSTALRMIKDEDANSYYERRLNMSIPRSYKIIKNALSSIKDKAKIKQYHSLLEKIWSLPVKKVINGVLLESHIDGIKIISDEKETLDVTFDSSCLFIREYAKENNPVYEEIVSSKEILVKGLRLVFFMKKNEENVAIMVKQIFFI